MIIGYAVAFQASWVLGLLSLLSLAPLLMGGFAQFRLTKMYRKVRNSNEEGNRIAIESIENVYTVQILGLQEKFVAKYKVWLKEPFWYANLIRILKYYDRYNVITATIQSALYAAIQATQLVITAIIVAVSAFIHTSNRNSVYYVDFNDIMRYFKMSINFVFILLNIQSSECNVLCYTDFQRHV